MSGALQRRAALFGAVLLAGALGGCATSHHALAGSGGALPPLPSGWRAIANPVPRYLPPAPRGNPPFYDVNGRRYYVLASAAGYNQVGVASWYGPTFDGKYTADGERYDMYAMTAANKVLPLPTYVRVTDLSNGRSIIVKVNDRGPFVAHRLIDLSYVAAAKLGMLGSGTALVDVQAITPGSPATVASAMQPVGALLYVQVGAFTVPANAARVLARLQAAGMANAFILSPSVTGGELYRVRVGPISAVDQYDRLAARLTGLGYPGAILVKP
ncbi:MAG: septal ring lytic transglycosylase RlpA family protein [Steroidobacteraceae bacterium]